MTGKREPSDGELRDLERAADVLRKLVTDTVEEDAQIIVLADRPREHLRWALRRIAEFPCDNNDTGDEPECPVLLADGSFDRLCPSCEARAALAVEEASNG